MSASKQNIGAVLFFGGAVAFFAYPQIVKMGAKNHPDKDYTKMSSGDKIIMGLSVASFIVGGIMFVGEDIGILKTSQ
jgi:hypothetical protein